MTFRDEILARERPPLLSHYTTRDGLFGIVSSRCLWATSIKYLNDASEFAYAQHLCRKRLEIHDENPSLSPASRHMGRELLRALDHIGTLDLYVASFSAEEDLLSQWRSYCPNADGYSIGFMPDQLSRIASSHPFQLLPCVYEPLEQWALIDETVARFLDAPPVGESAIDTAVANFMIEFITLAPMLKDRAFSEEREWRLASAPLSMPQPNIDYRPAPKLIIPFYRLPLAAPDHPLEFASVIIGPTPHSTLSLNSLNAYLASKSVTCRSATVSTIPYRSW